MLTWGQYLPEKNVYFVFGNDAYDKKFLEKSCLKDTSPLTSSLAVEEYICPHGDHHAEGISYPNSTVNILLFKSCRGTYYGKGPTCRCQSSLIWYMESYIPQNRIVDIFASSSSNASNQWAVFIDDDIYFRPYALISMIDYCFGNRSTASVFVADIGKNGMDLSKKWNRTLHTSCNRHYLPVAMPLIISIEAVSQLLPALKSNSMMQLQKLWGGTHDMIIGMLISMYGIPTYSFQRHYSNELFFKETGITLSDDIIIVHKVKNMKKSHKSVVDQYDVAMYFYDQTISNNSKYSLDNIIRRQILAGANASKDLIALPNTLNQSRYHSKFMSRRGNEYVPFVFEDC